MREARRRARAPRPRRAPTTTSTATATARSRSADRAAPAADRDATRPARACRPNCRSRRRPNRPRRLICASGLPVSVSKVPRPVLVFVAGVDRRRPDGVAQRRRPVRLRRLGADHGRGTSASSRGLPSAIVIAWSGTPHQRLVVFEEFQHFRLGGEKTRHQRANLLAVGLALSSAAPHRRRLLLRVVAQRRKPLHCEPRIPCGTCADAVHAAAPMPTRTRRRCPCFAMPAS